MKKEDEIVVKEATDLMHAHQYEVAGRMLRKVMNLYSYSPELAEMVAYCDVNSNNYHMAIGELRQIIYNDPLRLKAYTMLSRVYLDIGNVELSCYGYVVNVVEHISTTIIISICAPIINPMNRS